MKYDNLSTLFYNFYRIFKTFEIVLHVGRILLDDVSCFRYDIRRFCPQVSKDNVWVNERSHEAYAKNYSMVFPHDEPLAGRNMKKDPLYQVPSIHGLITLQIEH